MLIMCTVCFDTSGPGRLMLVLLVLLAFKAQGKRQLMLMMGTVWFDTFRTGAADPYCLYAWASRQMANDAHDAHGLV